MTKRLITGVILALLLLGAPLVAQVAVGQKAPTIDADEILDSGVKSLSELDGRLILYEFFAYW